MNNHNQGEYKFEINFHSLRNKIKFNTNINKININKINLEICNQYIKNIYYLFNKFNFNFNEIEIQANEINYGIKINNDINFNKKFKEIININININNDNENDNEKLIILRNFDTFHQTDDNIKKYLYKILTKFFILNNSINNFILIGGEMYIFAYIIKYLQIQRKILNSNLNISSYSDFQSIIDDTPDFANPILIDYDTFILPKLEIESVIICNTSKSGLTNNMSEQIISYISYISYIILIECSEKSNKKLKYYLQNNNLIKKIIKYKINYCTISLIKLTK